jgi:hypothetical protein
MLLLLLLSFLLLIITEDITQPGPLEGGRPLHKR